MNDLSDLSPGEGSIRIQVTTAGGALPVEGVIVQISGYGENDSGVFRSLRTDGSGLTPVVTLPAPPASGSLSPEGAAPYALYNIVAAREDYYTAENVRVPVFDGVRAFQPIALTPISEFGEQSPAGEEERLRILEVPEDSTQL